MNPEPTNPNPTQEVTLSPEPENPEYALFRLNFLDGVLAPEDIKRYERTPIIYSKKSKIAHVGWGNREHDELLEAASGASGETANLTFANTFTFSIFSKGEELLIGVDQAESRVKKEEIPLAQELGEKILAEFKKELSIN